MQNTIDQFKSNYSAINARFDTLGARDPGKDGCFFGVNRGVIARQMMAISTKTGETNTEALLDRLRTIYLAVESEVRGGLSSDCRGALIDCLVEATDA